MDYARNLDFYQKQEIGNDNQKLFYKKYNNFLTRLKKASKKKHFSEKIENSIAKLKIETSMFRQKHGKQYGKYNPLPWKIKPDKHLMLLKLNKKL